ncbi:MAG: hypothetical protein FJY20_06205 [Bacteroidetes bacterium]|nr:hypothetical protein [Bacteroidota bacterium]
MPPLSNGNRHGRTIPDYLNARGAHGFTLLHHAQKGGDDAKELLEFLQSKGLKETKTKLLNMKSIFFAAATAFLFSCNNHETGNKTAEVKFDLEPVKNTFLK